MVDLSWNVNPTAESRSPKFKSMAPPVSQPQGPVSSFTPCASTASLFLYAQGSVISCLHHDTLALERRFENHQEDICFISVDNVSERGAGRLVVSYDIGKTAIVWDLFTGSVIARFASFEQLRVAAWMRDGNVAFGNEKGDVILFEPSTSENASRRTIFDPITALAPGSDCRTYAIGYQNGSILIANLHPTFSVLHTLNTSRGPSPIVSLAWHASSSKQKSDMLATLASNGDLRVWSVAKPPGKEAPRVIRVLKRSDASSSSEPKWMAWSKNGKIIQYLDGETWAWDVRTKHVTYEPIPTIEALHGIANYGPTATLFTLGSQYTVQQYDLDNPAMVANVQHLPLGMASNPIEEARSRSRSHRTLQDPLDIRESSNPYGTRRTPFDSNGMDKQRVDTSSPVSSRSHAKSVSSTASSGKYRPPFSPPSRSGLTGTSFSLTSASERDTPQPSAASYTYPQSVSTSSVKSSRAGSRLRNEVQFSPADKSTDLFPFTRARLNDVPFRNHPPLDETHLTPDDLRRQMLSVVFGCDEDIDGLINDELSRHPPGSHCAVLLAQWLGEYDSDQAAEMISSGPPSATDWMLFAFSQMSAASQASKVGEAFVQKLLKLGDVHTAATILLSLGDRNDAIEVYVSQNYFMEAILMTCLLMPTEWQRQSYLVRRWGEHVVSHSQQQLAIRCFMCTGAEPSAPWASPSAQQATSFAEVMSQRSPLASPEPPYMNPANLMPTVSRPQSAAAANNRLSAKGPSLKLITSFDSQQGNKFRFPGLKSDDRTPTNVPGVTPIAESAVAESAFSPGGFGSYRSNNQQSINTAVSSRTGTPGFSRGRLPSIGETPVDVHPPNFPANGSSKSVDYGSTSENEEQQGQSGNEEQLGLLSSARYNPDEAYKPSPQTAVQANPDKWASIKGLPSPSPGLFEALREQSDSRNGSRDRMPGGLELQLRDVVEAEMREQSDVTMASFRSPASVNSFSTKSPSLSGRSIDPYISSLDEANYHARKHQTRPNGRARRNTDDSVSQASTRHHRSRNPSQETRGRNDKRYIQPAKRSPSSPVPMSPEEIARYSTKNDDSRRTKDSSKARSTSRVRKPRSRNSSERRKNRSSSRNTARAGNDPSGRGRSIDRPGSRNRSPSSPLPMSTTDDALRLVTSDRERLRVQQRSSSRRAEKGAPAKRDPSPDMSRVRARSHSHSHHDTNGYQDYPQGEASASGNEYNEPTIEEVSKMLSEETRNRYSATAPPGGLSEKKRKELAAAELEARRLSLARNPSAPNIPLPGEPQRFQPGLESPPFSVHSFGPRTPGRRRVSASKVSPEYPSSSDSNSSRSGGPLGLPATPKAMKHPKYNGYEETTPAVPNMPDSTLLLSDAKYQGDAERVGRSMSVPVPESQHPGPIPTDLPMHPRFNPRLPRSRSTSRSRKVGQRRESSNYGGSPVTISIEETIENAMQKRALENPPILPELQHLNTPPPPPPPIGLSGTASPRESSGTIDIAIDNEDMGRMLPRAMTAAPAPSMETRPMLERRRMSFDHRRGKSVNESFSTKIRNLARMGSTSRGPEVWISPPELQMSSYEGMFVNEGRI